MGRAEQPQLPPARDPVGLPPRPFFFSLDQIANMLNMTERNLIVQGYVHLEGRSIGAPLRDQFIARNVAPADQKPEWRVSEREFIRWLKRKGFKYYDRGSVTH